MSGKRRSVVLDTSAFIAGFDPSSISEETYSVPEVEAELLNNSISKMRFKTSVESGKLKVIAPSPKFIKFVKRVSSEIGETGFLSEADVAILALAIQLRNGGLNPTIVTDDYSIQNVADKLGLKFMSLSSYGIRYQLHWALYCPACGKRYPSGRETMICENCGAELKRKPLKKKPARRR